MNGVLRTVIKVEDKGFDPSSGNRRALLHLSCGCVYKSVWTGPRHPAEGKALHCFTVHSAEGRREVVAVG